MAGPTEVRIQLCGNFAVSIGGERRERDLPGRQGRLLFAYLVLGRMRPCTRSELVDAVWGEDPPEAAEAGLSALLSKLRKVVQVEGSHDLRLSLPLGAHVDVEAATSSLHAAESAVAAGNWDAVWGPAHVALYVSERPFLGGEDLPWVEEERRRLEGIYLSALECLAACGPQAGGAALATAERCARRLVAAAPFRETGYLHLMQALVAKGNRAEALRVYDELRCRLRDELGTAPGPMIQGLHQRLLRSEDGSPGRPAEPRLPRPRADGAVLGRDADLARLRGALEAAAGGKQRTALLTGEPGIGKTRLAVELCRSAHAAGMEVLFGRCDEQALVAYQPIVEALRQHLALSEPDQLAQQLSRCGGALAMLLPEVAQHFPAGTAGGDPYRLFESVLELLRAAARDRPVVLAVDDIHAADPATVRLLQHVGTAAGDAPLLLLLTCREGEEPAAIPELRRAGPLEQIQLRGLDLAGVSDLIAERAGERAPAPFVRAVLRRTGGNPFFVEELIGNLLESGALVVQDGRWTWDLSNEEVVLSAGVKDLVERRLARLSGDCRAALAAAAVVGGEFRIDLLAASTGSTAAQLSDSLEEAVRAGVVVEAGSGYAFAHPLVHETIYGGLPAARRRNLHGRIARSLAAETAGAATRELAHHFGRAGEDAAEQAIRYSLAAADEAARQLDHEQVVRLLDQALELLPSDAERRQEVLKRRAIAHANCWHLTYERHRFAAPAPGG